MRLTLHQRQAIVDSTRETIGARAKTYLFGSRTDDATFGADIDLLVEVSELGSAAFPLKIRAVGRIQRKIGERKIDFVVTDGSDELE